MNIYANQQLLVFLVCNQTSLTWMLVSVVNWYAFTTVKFASTSATPISRYFHHLVFKIWRMFLSPGDTE